MKKLNPVCWTWIVFLWAGLAPADTLKVAGDPWPPFVERTLPGQGLAVLLVTTALERAGYDSEVTIAEWTHIRQGAELGIFDVLAGVWYSDERNKSLAFSEPYWTNRLKLIKRTDTLFTFDEILRAVCEA